MIKSYVVGCTYEWIYARCLSHWWDRAWSVGGTASCLLLLWHDRNAYIPWL